MVKNSISAKLDKWRIEVRNSENRVVSGRMNFILSELIKDVRKIEKELEQIKINQAKHYSFTASDVIFISRALKSYIESNSRLLSTFDFVYQPSMEYELLLLERIDEMVREINERSESDNANKDKF